MSDVSQDLFIAAGVNLTEKSAELPTVINIPKRQIRSRWETQQGNNILSRWKANSFKREILDEMVGRFHGHTDLRGIPLAGEKLHGADLSNVDFFHANFEAAEFERVDMTNSWLSHSNLRKTSFRWSKMDGVLIDDVEFDDRTSFHGIDLKTINFNLAALLQESALADLRIQHLKRRNPILAWFLKITCDYGRSFPRFLCCCLILIIIFGFGFYTLPHALSIGNLWDCMFFSFLCFIKASSKDLFVTSTLGQLLFISEATIGYIMLGVLIAIIVRKTIGR
jgi:uncharacterized protein YjbI with pentapeptide repeats